MKRSRRRAFTLVELLVVIAIIGTLVGLLLPAVQNAREAGRSNQCRANLTNLQKAMSQYEVTNEEFPGYVNRAGSLAAQTTASWGAMILPFIERTDLWDKYSKGQQAAAPIEIYVCPSNPPQYEGGPGMSYLANAGWIQDEKVEQEGDDCSPKENPANGVFFDRTRGLGSADVRDLAQDCMTQEFDPIPVVKFAHIQAKGDGSTNVLMFAEGLNAIAWTGGTAPNKKWHFGFCWEDPAAIAAAQKQSTDSEEFGKAYRIVNGVKDVSSAASVDAKPPNSAFPSSNHPGGINVAFVGGQVILLRDRIDPVVYAQLMTSNRKQSDLTVNGKRERDLPQPGADDY